jgi:hypothetical protein
MCTSYVPYISTYAPTESYGAGVEAAPEDPSSADRNLCASVTFFRFSFRIFSLHMGQFSSVSNSLKRAHKCLCSITPFLFLFHSSANNRTESTLTQPHLNPRGTSQTGKQNSIRRKPKSSLNCSLFSRHQTFWKNYIELRVDLHQFSKPVPINILSMHSNFDTHRLLLT